MVWFNSEETKIHIVTTALFHEHNIVRFSPTTGAQIFWWSFRVGSPILKLLQPEHAPLSLKVSLRSIREGRFQTLDQCLIREYRLTSRTMSCEISSDFCEWDPPALDLVSNDMVDGYFSPLSTFEHELELPTQHQTNSSGCPFVYELSDAVYSAYRINDRTTT